MLYEYEDKFLLDCTTTEELQTIENDASDEISRLGVTDNFFREKLTKCKVYMKIAKNSYEDETVQKKYALYKKEFEEYLRESKGSASNKPFNIPIGR